MAGTRIPNLFFTNDISVHSFCIVRQEECCGPSQHTVNNKISLNIILKPKHLPVVRLMTVLISEEIHMLSFYPLRNPVLRSNFFYWFTCILCSESLLNIQNPKESQHIVYGIAIATLKESLIGALISM